ncbi:hypothetical protein D8B46_03465 [Candidatus Gracilibacteria bacterium]|nr:MAG: hypothetical protein D8B46_03465 [Candidatus Gracilibacteria bacterium]
MTMQITKSGFYNLEDFGEISRFEISDGLKIIALDNGKTSKEIIVGKDVDLKICGFLEKEENYEIVFRQIGEKSNLEVNYLNLAKNSEKIKAKIHSKIESNFSQSDVFVSSICGDNGEVDLDGIIELAPNFRKMAGHLTEENIFLGDKGRVRGIPALLVKSNEVEASHACKIEKISEEDLFYLRSRGIDKQNASFILVESKVKNIFKNMENEEIYPDLIEKILGKIF